MKKVLRTLLSIVLAIVVFIVVFYIKFKANEVKLDVDKQLSEYEQNLREYCEWYVKCGSKQTVEQCVENTLKSEAMLDGPESRIPSCAHFRKVSKSISWSCDVEMYKKYGCDGRTMAHANENSNCTSKKGIALVAGRQQKCKCEHIDELKPLGDNDISYNMMRQMCGVK